MTGELHSDVAITEDEAALYDRQIRLWGLDAQKRLRASRVLLVNIGGLGAEVAKNLVLAGVGALTVCDCSTVTGSESVEAQFFIPTDKRDVNRASASIERIQRLNPMVAVDTLCVQSIDALTADDVTGYHVLVATQCSQRQLTELDTLCRSAGLLFLAGDVFGFYGVCFSDLGLHKYVEEVKLPAKLAAASSADSGEPVLKRARATETASVQRQMLFSHIERALQFDGSANSARALKLNPAYYLYRVLLQFQTDNARWPAAKMRDSDSEKLMDTWSSLQQRWSLPDRCIPKDFNLHCFGQLSPVCAVVGGVLSQEVIKAVSNRDQPLHNMFLFNGRESEGVVESFGEE